MPQNTLYTADIRQTEEEMGDMVWQKQFFLDLMKELFANFFQKAIQHVLQMSGDADVFLALNTDQSFSGLTKTDFLAAVSNSLQTAMENRGMAC